MGCKRFQKQLHLNRHGELSEREKRLLDRHLASCADCSAEAERIQRADLSIAAVRGKQPVPSNSLADRIVASIPSPDQDMPLFKTVRRRVDEVIESRWTRFGLAAAASFAMLAFFLQEAHVLYRVSRLEKRMTAVSESRTGSIPFIQWGVPSAVERMSMAAQAENAIAELPEEWVAVRKTDLEALVKSYRDSRRFNEVLLNVLQEYRPELNRLNDAALSDIDGWIRLLQQRPHLIKPISRFSRNGGQT
jgi:hypothetical protein